jgi:ribosomal protein S18 acetylase RimI-like enzyme
MDHGMKRNAPSLTVEESLPEDRDAVAEISRRADVFNPEEEATVLELFDAYIQTSDSGYVFLSARAGDDLAGFACWGSTPLTEGTYDLYWICAERDRREQGVGRKLFQAVEDSVRALRGRMIVIETSTGDAYLPAVRFYEHMGCRQAARITDYYRPGEDLLVYVKYLSPSANTYSPIR